MQNKKRGNALGFWFFRTLLKLSGLSGAYRLLYPVCLYYLLFDRTAVSNSMAYVRRRFRGENIVLQYLTVYKLFISLGKSLIDRFYFVSGMGRFDTVLPGYDRIKSLLDESGKGFILLTAHVGNWQVTMASLEKLGKKVYLLMAPEENAAVRDSLNIDVEKGKIKIISPKDHLGGVIEIIKAIDEGSIVSIMGDRSYGGETVEVDLMGEKAHFPHSAFTIAAAVGCPVVVLLSAKVSNDKYIVDVSNIIDVKIRSRKEKKKEISEYVQKYADILESYSAAYPLQWFIFSNIWKKEKSERES